MANPNLHIIINWYTNTNWTIAQNVIKNDKPHQVENQETEVSIQKEFDYSSPHNLALFNGIFPCSFY